jgi:hypothetical protein
MQIVDIECRVRSFTANGFGAAALGASLACLRDDAMTVRFHRWLGRSGERYTATVYPIDHAEPAAGLPDLGPAVLIAVARHNEGRDVIGLMAIERDSDWTHAAVQMHAGADEWHVHLLAPDRAARASVVVDLKTSKRLASVA